MTNDELTALLQADPVAGPILKRQASGQGVRSLFGANADTKLLANRLKELDITIPKGTWISEGKVQGEWGRWLDPVTKYGAIGATALAGGALAAGIAGAGVAGAAAPAAAAPGSVAPAVAGGVLPSTTTALGASALPAGGVGLSPAISAASGGGFSGGLQALMKNRLLQAGVATAGGMLPDKASQSTTPTFDPAYMPLRDRILAMTMQRLGTSADLSGYGASGQQNINRTFDLIKQSQGNDLTARGLGSSPVAGTVDATRENARAGQTAGFLNSLPLLQRDLQLQDLAMASDLVSQGRGQQTKSSAGGGWAGGASALAGYLGYLNGMGAFKKQGQIPGQTPPYFPQTWG